MKSSAIKGSILVILSAFIFGFSPILIKLAYLTAITPMTLSVCCYFLATVFLTGYFIALKLPFKIGRRDVVIILLFGLIFRGGLNLCFFIGYQYISASLGELIFFLYPAFTVIAAYFLLKEAFTLKKVLAVIISFSGCFFVLNGPLGLTSYKGALLLLLAAVINAGYVSFSSVLMKRISPLKLAYYSGMGAFVTFLLSGLFSHTLTWSISGENIFYILAIAVGIVLAMVLFLSGISLIGPGRSALLSTFEPVSTIVTSALILGERLVPIQILGAVLVIFSAGISGRPAKKQQQDEAPEAGASGPEISDREL